jgi:hypothetical protein
MNPVLRKKRVWNVADFAAHAGWHFLKARRFLLKIDKKHGGKLFLPRNGPTSPYEFCVATLAKLEADLFEPIESLEVRVEELEERVGQHDADIRRTALQVGSNTRDIAKMRTSRSAA